MRVLMIGPYPQSLDRINGGVAAATTYLSQALVCDPRIELIGVRVTKWHPDTKSDHFAWPIENLALGRFAVSTFYYRQRRRFSELFKRFNPDIVHAQGADVAGFVAVGSGRRTVVTVHGLLRECAGFRTNAIARLREQAQATLTEKRTIRRAGHLIAISPYVAQYYGSEIRGRVHSIPNAVAPKFFQVERTPEAGRFLYAGRISRGKGLNDLVRAVSFAKASVHHLVLAGAAPDPAYELQLREEIRSLGVADRIEFTGLLDESSLLSEFSRAEALVLPSYQETAPMVIQQAMAAGLAVIATNVGGVPLQIEHGVSGLMFEPGDIDELHGFFARFRRDATLSGRLGGAGKVTASNWYRAETVARLTSAVYQEMMSCSPIP